MYDTIGVPLDGSDVALRALPVATSVAQRVGATLVLVAVIRTRKASADIVELEDLVSSLVVVARVRLEFGDEPAELVANAVLRNAHRPVLLVGPACDRDNRDAAPEAYVASVAPRLAEVGVDVAWTILNDPHPARALAKLTTTEPPSLVAMATHGSSGLARVVLGSAAAAMIGAAPCPVLMVRPSGLDASTPPPSASRAPDALDAPAEGIR